ncbi:septal ring lytic transglycosylase RlpA family protein [Bradyrhizobium sp. Tv2a-2]|uniref:septal ring lytic transglycosylase RlpA family protein n=1 Tax=Bradyrhizobium sp. Tv2a-2 TaxID=113395 RepID=UPI0004273C99|nr:septal ring lytic transglycosylase RlpA family protein [Bradyrhizobium sp. Tv2a-2]
MTRLVVLVALVVAIAGGLELAHAESGLASWYGKESGRYTASGARFNPEGPTCAMRTRRWRWVVVTDLATGRSARCYVNDYGPAAWTGRVIDVSHGVAGALGFAGQGTARVEVVDQ